MSSARKSGSGRASGGRPARSRARRRRAWLWLRRAALAVLAAGFVAGLLASRWVLSLDRIVVERFEGRRFSVPSRVLSSPTILYPGLDWQRSDLRGTLVRLGYRDGGARRTLPPGYYRWQGDRVRAHLRAFDHPSRPEPERDVLVRLDGPLIDSIREMPQGRELGLVMLEPEPVGAFYGSDREQRELVRLDDVPRHLIDAILAVEDQRFESHHGIDPKRIGGAVLVNIRSGGIRQGASTLTQQLVKNFFLTPERTFTRKFQEAAMALLVEARYDKPAILQAYLNEIYLGQRGSTAVHGVGEAARLYFGKAATDLTVAESALLAAIIQSPNGISPFRDPERATERRDLVLGLMHAQGRLDDAELARARREPLQLAAVTPDPGEARYFLDVLRRQLPELYDEAVLAAEGLRIHSTLDLRLQRLASDVLLEGLQRIEEHHPELRREDPAERLQGCILALRPQTGEVLALVGGRSYAVSQFDRCTQARRSAGSVFKPVVYVAALEPRGGAPVITLADFLDDSPLEVKTPSGPWRPQNIDREFRGPVPVRLALEKSLNVPAARLGQMVGIERVAQMARRLGIESELPRVPSLALGAGEVSPLEMARAYATLANGGVRTEPHTFEDVVTSDGETLERRELRFERVVDPATAFLATSLLRGVVERGTAAGLARFGLSGPIAGKTGTSDDERDLWFAGYTPELVVVVWVGFDEPRSIGLQSSRVALPLWARFVREAQGGAIRGNFRPPAGVERAWIDPQTGALAMDDCPERREEVFVAGTLPEAVCGDRGGRWTSREPRRNLFDWLRDVL